MIIVTVLREQLFHSETIKEKQSDLKVRSLGSVLPLLSRQSSYNLISESPQNYCMFLQIQLAQHIFHSSSLEYCMSKNIRESYKLRQYDTNIKRWINIIKHTHSQTNQHRSTVALRPYHDESGRTWTGETHFTKSMWHKIIKTMTVFGTSIENKHLYIHYK